MDLKVIGSIPIIYPIYKIIFNTEIIDSKEIRDSIDTFNIDCYDFIESMLVGFKKYSFKKNFTLLGSYYSNTFCVLLTSSRSDTYNSHIIMGSWKLYYIYYISNLFYKNLSNYKYSKYERYNILTINFISKQFRISILTSNSLIFNLSTGRVLAALNIKGKSKKKSDKGERLFLEYIPNFILINKYYFGKAKLTHLNILGLRKGVFNDLLLKNLNKNLSIISSIFNLKLPNCFSKFKRVSSIKRRFRKLIIKNENSY